MEELELTKENLMECVDTATGKPIDREGDVVLPERVIYHGKEYKLTRISGFTFYGCSGLTSVTIPESVVSIGINAFSECIGLTCIIISDSVTSIEEYAFAGCNSLTSVTIPEGVKGIERFAFCRCSSLTSVTIPNSVTSIKDYAFYQCSSLTSVNIPVGVTSIGSHAFSDCNSLSSIAIPDSVTSIGDSAFNGCSGLTSVTIPDGVTSIGNRAFNGCSGLTSVTIPDSVTSIGIGAFCRCSSLMSVTIPDSVTSIENDAFLDCNSLISVTIPAGVKSIGNRAFCGCSVLTSIYIPKGVVKIRYGAFAYSGLNFIDIPDGVTNIGHDAFEGCKDSLLISFMGSDILKSTYDMVKDQSDGLPGIKCLTIAKKAVDILGKDIYSPVLVSKFCNAEHGGKLEQTAIQIKKDFNTIGFYDIKNSVDVKVKEKLTVLFQEDSRSHGVVPKIIDALTIASTELNIPPEEIVKSFEEKKFRNAVMAMRSCNKGNRFCDMEAVLFAMNFDVNTVKNVVLENPNKDYASVLLCESYKKNDGHLLDLSKWVASHPDVSQDLVKDIVKYGNSITINASDNVDAVRVQISRGRATLEIQEIEKAYPSFKFADCKCNLPKTEVELDNYRAYIMDAHDPRQVMIGYDTDCCQHLDGAGETAMMYGLVNPDAGFFVIEDKTSGKILAQAETWQSADGEKLVFDNIEFADDRQIGQFAPVLAKWCEESPYPDIFMGNGCNEMVNGNIRKFEGMMPPVVDEMYQLLAEMDEDFDWNDCLYTDADKSCSVLKHNSTVEPYFQEAYDSYVQEHKEFPDIGSFFSEPPKGDILAFSREEKIPEEIAGKCEKLENREKDHSLLEDVGRSDNIFWMRIWRKFAKLLLSPEKRLSRRTPM